MSVASRLHSQERLLAEAMRRAQAGDGEAYRELLETVQILLQAYAKRLLARMGIAEGADDAVQEILLAVHLKRHTYDPSRLFTPWLFAIARYKLIDFARARRRLPGDVLPEDLAAPEQEAGASVDLQALLAELPPKQREALRLVKLEGLSVAEASEETHMSESAIKVSVHRAMKGLKARIRGEEKP